MKRSRMARRNTGLNRLQRLKPPLRELRFGRAEARPFEASLSKTRPSEGSLALGIMSGTSGDGIDVALVRVSGRKARLENFAAIPFPARVREAILRLGEGRATTTSEISQLNFLLGEGFWDGAPG